MSALSSTAMEKARKAYARVLQTMQASGTARNIAQICGVSEATISRAKGDMEDSITLLYHLGYKVVPADCQMLPAEYISALHTLAKVGCSAPPRAATLEWE